MEVIAGGNEPSVPVRIKFASVDCAFSACQMYPGATGGVGC